MFTFNLKGISKVVGTRLLYKGLDLSLVPGEKVGLIGRNGEGKSTLLNIISGQDKEFGGEIESSRNVKILITKQEHHDVMDVSPLDYITAGNADFKEIKDKLLSYEREPDKEVSLEEYCDLLNIFAIKDYYTLEDKTHGLLEKYSLVADKLSKLSGGQKRILEIIKVSQSDANIVLMDEPTNHLDYMQKADFIQLLSQLDKCCLIVSHDRDVLENVDRILEIKDKQIFNYKGNYSSYIKQNTISNLSKITDYESRLKKADQLEKQQKKVIKSLSATSKSTKIIIERMERAKQKAKANLEKPDFWIDKTSVSDMDKEDSGKYEKYKSTNIKLQMSHGRIINDFSIHCADLQITYDSKTPLFSPLSFRLNPTDRLEIRGRNGAGKSSFIKYLMYHYKLERNHDSNEEISSKGLPSLLSGRLSLSKKLDIGIYEQEFNHDDLNKTVAEVLETEYHEHNLTLDNTTLSRVLSNFLFDPVHDRHKQISILSGGQKSRIQIIKLLVTKPNLLILDEPTNHLDLPSIEELEEALKEYSGAIIYITHDDYFRKAIGGRVIEIGAQ